MAEAAAIQIAKGVEVAHQQLSDERIRSVADSIFAHVCKLACIRDRFCERGSGRNVFLGTNRHFYHVNHFAQVKLLCFDAVRQGQHGLPSFARASSCRRCLRSEAPR
jgi:hypothetical protein